MLISINYISTAQMCLINKNFCIHFDRYLFNLNVLGQSVMFSLRVEERHFTGVNGMSIM